MFDVIVLDLDGTLLKDDKTISCTTLNVLKKFEDLGKKIVIATGRPPRLDILDFPEELKREFMIFYNGAEIYHNNEKIYTKCISDSSIKYMINLLNKQNANPKISFEINNKLYSNYNANETFKNTQFTKINLEDFNYNNVTKLLVDLSSIEHIKSFSNSIPNDCNLLITDNSTLGQIMAKGVSKLSAIEFILNKLDTTLDKVIFFGDDINDIELIKHCGIGVAMGNAHTSVKSASKYITESNENDGIAVFLNKFAS